MEPVVESLIKGGDGTQFTRGRTVKTRVTVILVGGPSESRYRSTIKIS